jgi:hypothetical protein
VSGTARVTGAPSRVVVRLEEAAVVSRSVLRKTVVGTRVETPEEDDVVLVRLKVVDEVIPTIRLVLSSLVKLAANYVGRLANRKGPGKRGYTAPPRSAKVNTELASLKNLDGVVATAF